MLFDVRSWMCSIWCMLSDIPFDVFYLMYLLTHNLAALWALSGFSVKRTGLVIRKKSTRDARYYPQELNRSVKLSFGPRTERLEPGVPLQTLGFSVQSDSVIRVLYATEVSPALAMHISMLFDVLSSSLLSRVHQHIGHLPFYLQTRNIRSRGEYDQWFCLSVISVRSLRKSWHIITDFNRFWIRVSKSVKWFCFQNENKIIEYDPHI